MAAAVPAGVHRFGTAHLGCRRILAIAELRQMPALQETRQVRRSGLQPLRERASNSTHSSGCKLSRHKSSTEHGELPPTCGPDTRRSDLRSRDTDPAAT